MEVYQMIAIGAGGLAVVIILMIIFLRGRRQWDADEKAKDDDAFRIQVGLVDEKILEMNEYYTFIKEEIEKKHKELLFLYDMISEKEKDIRAIQLEIEKLKAGEAIVAVIDEEATEEADSQMGRKRKIIELKEQGYTPKEIAKIMSIGQGEVQLVLNLFE